MIKLRVRICLVAFAFVALTQPFDSARALVFAWGRSFLDYRDMDCTDPTCTATVPWLVPNRPNANQPAVRN